MTELEACIRGTCWPGAPHPQEGGQERDFLSGAKTLMPAVQRPGAERKRAWNAQCGVLHPVDSSQRLAGLGRASPLLTQLGPVQRKCSGSWSSASCGVHVPGSPWEEAEPEEEGPWAGPWFPSAPAASSSSCCWPLCKGQQVSRAYSPPRPPSPTRTWEQPESLLGCDSWTSQRLRAVTCHFSEAAGKGPWGVESPPYTRPGQIPCETGTVVKRAGEKKILHGCCKSK